MIDVQQLTQILTATLLSISSLNVLKKHHSPPPRRQTPPEESAATNQRLSPQSVTAIHKSTVIEPDLEDEAHFNALRRAHPDAKTVHGAELFRQRHQQAQIKIKPTHIDPDLASEMLFNHVRKCSDCDEHDAEGFRIDYETVHKLG